MIDKTCKERVNSHFRDRLADLKKMYNAEENTTEETGCLFDYGLDYCYVAPGTFNGQRRGYIRYQLSWGGPSDEFRFYLDENLNIDKIEYWFMDWFDGAKKTIRNGINYNFLCELYEMFGGSYQSKYMIEKELENA